jgi:hypothetical protein
MGRDRRHYDWAESDEEDGLKTAVLVISFMRLPPLSPKWGVLSIYSKKWEQK